MYILQSTLQFCRVLCVERLIIMNCNDTIKLIKYMKIYIIGRNMRINNLDIKGIGGIKQLKLNFCNGFNVICGANGIGKTTILNIIADAFANGEIKLKRNAECDEGQYTIQYFDGEKDIPIHRKIQAFDPRESKFNLSNDDAKYLLRFDVNRNYDYTALSEIKSDPKRDKSQNASAIVTGVQANDIKNWFVNRFAFHDKKDSLSPEEIENYNLTKKMFSVLDKTVQFKTVLAKSFDIILSTQKGDIYFEYLSAGYKSCIYIIMGIMKEIEYRFANKPIKIGDFNGCILIDEIEEHLHPSWQAGLVNALKTIFPKCQFIVTTHSPSILQSVEKNEIIPLYLNEEHETCVKELKLGDYGLQGWSLEEILKDVMDMPSTTSDLYKETIRAFDKAMDDEDVPEIKRNYEILNKMLHPNSTLRKLLQIQMAGLEE